MSHLVLVIEDNEQNLYLTRFLLESSGYQVAAANNGQDGIEAAQKLRPALILLDIQLPLMDGYTVARELRKVPELAKTPIVAVTSYAMVGDREKCLESGCTGYLEKPINPDTFLAEVQQFLPPHAAGELA